jgi:hypothetical protein
MGTLDSQDSPRPGFGGRHHLPPYSIFYTSLRRLHPNGFLSWDSWKEIPKLSRLGLPQLCGAITSCSDLQLGRGLKQSCSSHQELSNDVSHVTCTHENQVDSRLFVVQSQTTSLTPDLSFCHNLFYICSNGSCKPILYIYTSISFQWSKELPNAKFFDLYNRYLKVWESIGTPTPHMGAHLGVWVFIFTLSQS